MFKSCLVIFFIIVLIFNFNISKKSYSSNYSEYLYLYYSKIDDKFKFSRDPSEYPEYSYVVSGDYSHSLNTTGWNQLKIAVNKKLQVSDDLRARSMGVFEGYITAEDIENNIRTFKESSFPNGYPPELISFSEKMMNWINSTSSRMKTRNNYWKVTDLHIKQLRGIFEGWKIRRFNSLNNQYFYNIEFIDLFMMNLENDLEGIVPSLKYEAMKKNKPLSKQLKRIIQEREKEPLDHCSGLIKFTEDKNELFFAQTTWSKYNSMLRTVKNYLYFYKLNSTSYENDYTQVTFASYPGYLYSGDDWYSVDGHLGIIETTMVVKNEELFKQITPKMIPTFLRIPICNHIGKNGKDWSNCMKRNSAGSYPNEYFVIDYNYFPYGKKSNFDNSLIHYYVEIPGKQKDYSLTKELEEKSYLATYNIVRDKEIYQITGYPKLVQKFGDWFTFERHPRALIFQRDHYKVKNLESMKRIMRYNNYKYDPLSNGSPGNAISSRKDLVDESIPPPNPFLKASCFGGTDSKIGSRSMITYNKVHCVSGPTNDQQPVFSWSNSEICKKQNVKHYGQPDSFNFDWISFP